MRKSVEFYGEADILRKLENAGKNIELALTISIRKSLEKPKKEQIDFMIRHKRTGRTANSYTEKIESKNGLISVKYGFSVRNGGLPSIFWNYGTPRNAPPATHFIDNSIDKNIDEIIKTQRETLRQFL